MLTQMGWIHIFEHETVEGFSLDLAQPESKIAVEVNGPSHYLKDSSRDKYVVNGATRFKSRLLRSFGWTVAHIAFFDWSEKSKLERRQLLAKTLDKSRDERPKATSPAFGLRVDAPVFVPTWGVLHR